MTTGFAHPLLLRAAAIDGRKDPWIAEALHLRVRCHPELGFPLHPFAVWRAGRGELVDLDVIWITPDGKQVEPPFNPEDHGGRVDGTVVAGGGKTTPRWCWLEVDADPYDATFRVEVLDRLSLPTGAPRVLGARGEPPYSFGGSDLARIRVHGNGTLGPNGQPAVRGIHQDSFAFETVEGPPLTSFGLPRSAPESWYAQTSDPLGEAKRRLVDGADQRLGPPDLPEGPYDDPDNRLDPDGEAARVLDLFAPYVDEWIDTAYGNGGAPPLLATRPCGEVQQPGGALSSADLGAVDLLNALAGDPAIARYLGLATALPPTPTNPEDGPNVYLLAAQWAVRPGHLVGHDRPRPLSTWLTGQAPGLTGVLDGLFPDTLRCKNDIAAYNATLPPEEPGWTPVTLATLAVTAGQAPPDPPPPPVCALREPGRWNPGATTWTQRITLTGRAAEGPLAAARLTPAPGESLHRPAPDGRATTLLAPWSSATDQVVTPTGTVPVVRESTVTDPQAPDDPYGAGWRVRLADQWGRWGDPTDVSGPRPDRPAPPPPVLEGWFIEDATAPGPDGPRSPGVLRLTVTLPAPEHLAPGARPLASFTLNCADVDSWTPSGGGTTVTGRAITLPAAGVATGSPVLVDAVVRPFGPGDTATVTVTATSTDDEGRASRPALAPGGEPIGPGVLRREIHDPRALAPVPTGPRLLWCGRPDSTGRAELALTWPSPPGPAAYRVYLAQERRLAAALGLPPDAPTTLRAVRARRLWAHERQHPLAGKDAFSLLTEKPVTAGGSRAEFRIQLPGATGGVQFVRVVPLTSGGIETPFDRCGLVPVAVPTTDRPPAPLLRARPAGNGTAELTVEAPGLPTAFPAGAAPRYRLRRTRGTTTDPLFLPVVAEGDLVYAGGRWTATHTDGTTTPLPAFVRHTWTAEIRLPDEPDLDPAAAPVPSDVTPLWPTATGPDPLPWSAPSVPASTTPVPPSPPAAPTSVTAVRNPDGSATLTVPLPPLAHALAPAPYTAAVFRQSATTPTVALTPAPVTTTPFTLTDPTPGTHYRIALIDPLGRMGPPSPPVPT
ncbi:hypothetical protein [Streptomyces sp. NPDC005955]|uniref:hypothetical protein n=1 Tax=Streptomyces sp. NPDC005955 TaxID=3364738 RepID=UPI00367B15A9